MVHIPSPFNSPTAPLTPYKEAGTQRGNELAQHPASLQWWRDQSPKRTLKEQCCLRNPRTEGEEWGIWEEVTCRARIRQQENWRRPWNRPQRVRPLLWRYFQALREEGKAAGQAEGMKGARVSSGRKFMVQNTEASCSGPPDQCNLMAPSPLPRAGPYSSPFTVYPGAALQPGGGSSLQQISRIGAAGRGTGRQPRQEKVPKRTHRHCPVPTATRGGAGAHDPRQGSAHLTYLCVGGLAQWVVAMPDDRYRSLRRSMRRTFTKSLEGVGLGQGVPRRSKDRRPG